MNNKYLMTLIIILVPIISFCQTRHDISMGTGVSKAVGSGSEDWTIGYNINGEYFFKLSKRIFIGNRLSYNKWNIKDDPVMEELFGGEDVDYDFTGSKSMIEFLPSIKIMPFLNRNMLSRLYMQFGIGCYFVDLKIKYSYSYYGYSGTESMGGKDHKIGLNIGSGFNIGNTNKIHYSFCPQYNVIFADNDVVKYLTFNINAIF